MNSLSKLLLGSAIAAGAVWLLSSITSALAPFVFAAVIAYISAPVAQKLEERKMPPVLAAALIVLFILLLLILVPIALLPIIAAQVHEFSALLPLLTEKAHGLLGNNISEWLDSMKNGNIDLSVVGADGLQKTVNIAASLFGEGLAALSSLITIVLITPLAAFYFLRDRKSISGELTDFLPPHTREQILSISRELDSVLGEFLHGQLLVMLIMATFYSTVLTLAALPFALTIGIISGALTFIPYVGFVLGVLLATIAGFGSFDSVTDVVTVWVLMGIGTTMESMLITPRLVGERVGLHPIAVLLALMVMGDLFGFVGVLAALPTAAALLVCARHLRRHYIGSGFYGRQ